MLDCWFGLWLVVCVLVVWFVVALLFVIAVVWATVCSFGVVLRLWVFACWCLCVDVRCLLWIWLLGALRCVRIVLRFLLVFGCGFRLSLAGGFGLFWV